MSDSQSMQPPGDASMFQLLVESVKDYAIFALAPDGTIISWNRGAELLKGYPTAEAIGLHYSRFFTEEDQQAGTPQALLGEALRRGRATAEGWRVRRDGSRFIANVVITAIHGPDGAHAGFSKVTRDVTVQRAAEDALRVRERQLSDSQELAGLGSWEWSIEGDRVTWSDKLYDIYGIDRESFGATFAGYLERVHVDDRDRVRSLIEDAYRAGSPFAFEERIVRPDGTTRVLRSRGRAILDESGATIRLMGACFDITELKEAQAREVELAEERAARVSAERYAAGLRFLSRSSGLLASSLDYEQTLRTVAELAVPEVADWCAVDLVEGGSELRRVAVAHPDPEMILLAEEMAMKYPPQRDTQAGAWGVIDTGQPRLIAEISDALIESLATDAEHAAMAHKLGLRSAVIVPLAGRSSVLGALTLVHAESDRRFDEQDLSLLQELGRHAGLAIDNARLHQEVDAQNRVLEEQASELELRAEELETQAQHLSELMAELEVSNEEMHQRTLEAEEANRAKSDFLATMSHELRTPLNAIFGYADLLDLGLHGPVTPAQHVALERIKRNQRALLVLINDVLNFAKLEAGKLEIHIGDVPVGDILADVVTVVGPQLDAKGIEHGYAIAPPGLRVRGEQERVEQILLNLLTNALKFTPRGGSVDLSVDKDADEVRLHVRDTGPGIDPAQLERIFDPFVQVDRPAEDTGQRGVGLGLAISRDLAKAMGGTLSAVSEPGRGSTFTLALQRAADAT